jgi:hypothetical protein
VKRQTGEGGSTAHAVPNFFFPFPKTLPYNSQNSTVSDVFLFLTKGN